MSSSAAKKLTQSMATPRAAQVLRSVHENRMSSKKLGEVSFNKAELAQAIKSIGKIFFTQSYAEYAVGEWKTALLWSPDGSSKGSSQEYSGSATITENGKNVAYINNLIKSTFKTNLIKSVRIFSAKNNGYIFPHKDYLEFKKGFNRIHIPLQTNEMCINSENKEVYHMRVGEVWFVDGNNCHSGGCFSNDERLHLVLDFDPEVNPENIFKHRESHVGSGEYISIQRPELDEKSQEAIKGFAQLVTPQNLKSIAMTLGQLHYTKDCSAEDVFSWLSDISVNSGNVSIINEVNNMKNLFIEKGPQTTQ